MRRFIATDRSGKNSNGTKADQCVLMFGMIWQQAEPSQAATSPSLVHQKLCGNVVSCAFSESANQAGSVPR